MKGYDLGITFPLPKVVWIPEEYHHTIIPTNGRDIVVVDEKGLILSGTTNTHDTHFEMKPCEVCGEDFHPKSYNHKTCSFSCRKVKERNRVK